jgi:hypothetical protein
MREEAGGFTAPLGWPSAASAAMSPSLGAAHSFAAFGATGVGTNSMGQSDASISGDVGVSPGGTIDTTGITITGAIHAGDAAAVAAHAALTTAYQSLASQPCTQTLSEFALTGDQTLTPGVYCFSGSGSNHLVSGALTFDAQGDPNALFIFEIGDTLAVGMASFVLINGAAPCNIFWRVGGSAFLSFQSSLIGNILALDGIMMSRATNLQGRAFSLNGFVGLGSMASVTVPCPTTPVMTAVTLTADKTAPQAPGTTVTFTAAGAGGVTPYAFKFLLTTNNWGSWTVVQDWSSSATWVWTAGAANARYQVGVYARSAWDTADSPEVAAAMPFPIDRPVMTGVSLTADKPAPQPPGTTITLTAGGTGGLAPNSFKFFVTTNNWATYSVLRDWSTTPTYPWTPSVTGTYVLGVWARSAGNAADAPEQAAALPFPTLSTLTVNVVGSGTVTSNDGGIQCPGTCTHGYAGNALVTLTPAASGGWTFAGWSPAECATGVVAMAVDHTCSVVFLLQSFTPTWAGNINLSGGGFGDVFTYNAATGARAFEYSDGAQHFNEKRAAWPANLQIYPADWNGDGLTDFLVYNPVSGGWTKATNNGAGDFAYYSGLWPTGLQQYIVDLDDDNRSDVFNYVPANGLWTRCLSTPGDGTVAFACGANGQWPAGLKLYSGDFNADQLPDFFVYNARTGQWTLAINNGTTGYYYDSSGVWSAGLTILPGDFNQDGRTDLFAFNGVTGDWSLLITDLTRLPFPAPRYKFTNYAGHWSPGWGLTVGDFDGDGKADLFLYNEATGWRYEAISTGTGFTLSPLGTETANWKVQAADFDHDGKTDIQLYDPNSGQWHIAANSGLNLFTYSTGFWEPGLTVIASKYRR